MTAATDGAIRALHNASSEAPPLGRFHIATLVMRRARQLKDGARSRTEADGHTLCRLALMEVLAGAISWSVVASPSPGDA